jgi:O-antigen ligase
MRRLTFGLLMLYSFAVPWEYSLDVGEPFGNVARILGILLLATVPWLLMRGEMRRPGLVQWLVLTFYLYFVCSYFWTVDQLATLEKIRSYFQVMMAVWLIWEVAETTGHLRAMLRAFVAGCWVLAILTFVDFTSESAIAAGQIRFVASGQDPNDVARFLDLGFPLAALLLATERRWPFRLLASGYVPAGLLAVLLTASRGGFSAAMAALFGAAVLLVMARPRAASLVFVALAVMAGALWMFVPAGSWDRLATIPQEVGSGDWNDRLNIWDAGWLAFRQSPWWGSGAGTFTTASGLAPGDTAHNTVMAVLVTGGLLGTAIFSAIVASVGWSVIRTQGLLRVAFATTLAVWAITSMVGSVEENRATWLLFGLMALAGRISNSQPQSVIANFAGVRRRDMRARAIATGSRVS